MFFKAGDVTGFMNGDPGLWEHPWEKANSEMMGFVAAATAHRQGEVGQKTKT